MNTVVEVATAEGLVLMLEAVVNLRVPFNVAGNSISSAVATLVIFILQQGATSMNAISPVHTFERSLAVA